MVSARLIKLLGAAAFVVGLLCMPARAAGQWYQNSLVVDCSGSDPNAYTSFSAAMPFVTNSTAIWVRPGTVCNDNIYLNELTYVAIFTDPGSTYTLNGSLNIQNSRSVWIYGMKVTNLSGDGINIKLSDRADD